jgi:hypothetical protein
MVRLPFAYSEAMLTEKKIEEIRMGVKSGLRGPVMLKWVEDLVRDRDERMELERTREDEREDST